MSHWKVLGASVAIGMVALPGCVAYEPRPLDLEQTRTQFLERTIHPPSTWDQRPDFLGASPASAFAPENGLEAEEAEVLALLYNPDLQILRGEAAVVWAQADVAGLWRDPIFGLNSERLLESVPNPWILGGSLTLTLPLSGRIGAEKSAAGSLAAAATAGVLAREWETRALVRRQFLEWSAHRAQIEVLQMHLQRVAEIQATAERLSGAGALSELEVRLFALEQAARIADIRSREALVATAEAELRRTMGLSNRAPMELVPSLAPIPLPGQPAQRLQEAERRSPRLAVARAVHASRDAQVLLETRRQYPDLQISPGLSTEDGILRAILGWSMPLPVWSGNRAALREAWALRALSAVQFDVTLERLHGNLNAAEAAYAGAQALSAFLSQNLVPMAEAQAKQAIRLAELGDFDAWAMLDSLGRRYQAHQQWIHAQLALALAALDVWETVGPPEPVSETETPPSDAARGARS